MEQLGKGQRRCGIVKEQIRTKEKKLENHNHLAYEEEKINN